MADAWELVARWPGGTVTALAAVVNAGRSGLALAATAAGLHASADGGARWSWRGPGPSAVPEALALSPRFADDGTILLGTADGLYRSTDRGERWRPVLSGSRFQCLAAADADASSGLMLAGTEADGVLRSEDGGQDWAGASAGLLDLNVTALAISPAVARDRTAFAGTTSGLYRSRNGGRAWRLIELGPEAPVIQALAISPDVARDGLVLAGTEADGLFRSDDGGQTWRPVPSFPGPCVTSLAFHQRGDVSGGVLAAGTAGGVAISEDGGQTWVLEAPELGPILSLAWVEDNGSRVLLAGTVNAGVTRLAVHGAGAGGVWTPANDGLAGRAMVGLAVSTAYGTVPAIAVASLDAGVLLSHDAGASWQTGHQGLPDLAATSVTIVRRPSGEPSLLAAFGGRLYQSTDVEAGWWAADTGLPGDARATSLSAVGETTSATATVLAAGRGVLALSTDGGASWRALPLPAPGADVVGAAASPNVARDRTLYAVTRATRIGADGTVEGTGLELWHSDSLGERWSRWLEAPGAQVMPLAVPGGSVADAVVLVGTPGWVGRPLRDARERRGRERRPLWHQARIGAPLAAVTALALSPRFRRDRTVLAAADTSVYLSRDAGATFAAWDAGLGVSLVTGLAVVEDGAGGQTAYALGLGGTLWRRTVS